MFKHKIIIIGIMLVCYLSITGTVYGATRKAASCMLTDVQAEVNAASSGDTIIVPAGTATWATYITIPKSKNLNIFGAGIGKTNITCNGNASRCFEMANLEDNSVSRISGFTFTGVIGMSGMGGKNTVRVDHCRFINAISTQWSIYGVKSGHPRVLIDSNIIENVRFVVAGTSYQLAENNNQFKIWASDPDFGGPAAAYIESNTIYAVPPGPIDANYGGRYVFRFNTVYTKNTYVNEFHGVQGWNRAGQRWEVYNNNMTDNGTGTMLAYFRGGSGYYFNNDVNATYTHDATLDDQRSYRVDLGSSCGKCDGTRIIDGNTSGATGWPCRDQIGRVRDNSLFTGIYNDNVTPWPSQDLYPAYAWNNKRAGTTEVGFEVTSGSRPHIVKNRDYYQYMDSFDGTVGVGIGSLASRPSTCTTGVAYWATDQSSWNKSDSGGQGVLYKCTSTNTWMLHYTPYTYPHPRRIFKPSTNIQIE